MYSLSLSHTHTHTHTHTHSNKSSVHPLDVTMMGICLNRSCQCKFDLFFLTPLFLLFFFLTLKVKNTPFCLCSHPMFFSSYISLSNHSLKLTPDKTLKEGNTKTRNWLSVSRLVILGALEGFCLSGSSIRTHFFLINLGLWFHFPINRTLIWGA